MNTQLVTLTLYLSAMAVGSPVPNDSINPIIASLDNYFGTLAQNLIIRREVNETEKYQSVDGHTKVQIQPAGSATLQEILFHPTNQHLVATNNTELFNNGTNKVHLIKVDLVTKPTDHPETVDPKAESPETATTPQTLKGVPSSVVTGTTGSSTTTGLVSETISGNSAAGSGSGTTLSTKNSTPLVEIVTPVGDAASANATAPPTTTLEAESESKEIRDKVKEVEAEPVILTVGV
ncbi:uncharacterized protein LOC134214953 [Armigeres subalbatus]|uniref:uncharacterized protein LOC134214953 n=1 Tax=Armigeres subalbatus TaxID=124917 RepID=UPI002ED3EFF6